MQRRSLLKSAAARRRLGVFPGVARARGVVKHRAIKKPYDPRGRFFAHHGVGCEAWSAHGLARIDS
jgi:hypothetical protein